jgi:hypothetical protein
MTGLTTRVPAAAAMPTVIETGALDKTLRVLKLSGMLETIDARLAQARAGELGHIEFLQVLCVVCGLRTSLTISAHHIVDRLRSCWTRVRVSGRGFWLSTA